MNSQERAEHYGIPIRKDEDLFSTWDVTDKGYCINEKKKSVHAVFKDVNKLFHEKYPGLAENMDYFQVSSENFNDHPLPDYRWLGVFYVTGGSEGHYIHVEAIGIGEPKMDKRECLFLGKTFGGRNHAEEVVNALSRILEV